MQTSQTFLSAKAFIITLGFFGPPVQAQEAVGMRLEAAGFVMKRADTARKMERLLTLPKHKFVARSKNGIPYFIYADPDYCKCALIGDRRAMNSYRDMVSPPTPPPGVTARSGDPGVPASGVSVVGEMIHDMNEDGDAQMEDDIFHPGF